MAERDLIQTIRTGFLRSDPTLFAGIGDDCALFGNNADNPWMISTDMLVENVHFNLTWHDAYRLGRKAVAVNISDIAAMGGVPKFILLSLCFPSDFTEKWIEQFLQGVHAMCEETGCIVIGGDTVSGAECSLSVTVLGTSAGIDPVRRSGAKAGDEVYVSGNLGSAALGLTLFQHGIDKELNIFHLAHLDPFPQIQLGRKLAHENIASAMQDISDGVATDLAHICGESCVAAVIEEKLLPMEKGFADCCKQVGIDPTATQLKGGEDYQLLFTVAPEKYPKLNSLKDAGFMFCKIGEITQGQGVTLVKRSGAKEEISYQGYEHR